MNRIEQDQDGSHNDRTGSRDYFRRAGGVFAGLGALAVLLGMLGSYGGEKSSERVEAPDGAYGASSSGAAAEEPGAGVSPPPSEVVEPPQFALPVDSVFDPSNPDQVRALEENPNLYEDQTVGVVVPEEESTLTGDALSAAARAADEAQFGSEEEQHAAREATRRREACEQGAVASDAALEGTVVYLTCSTGTSPVSPVMRTIGGPSGYTESAVESRLEALAAPISDVERNSGYGSELEGLNNGDIVRSVVLGAEGRVLIDLDESVLDRVVQNHGGWPMLFQIESTMYEIPEVRSIVLSAGGSCGALWAVIGGDNCRDLFRP